VVSSDGPLRDQELRSYLKAQLPEYMIPAIFAGVRELPRTDRGKLDRDRLPAAEATGVRKESASPKDSIEIQLVKMWERTLGVSNIGVRDSFFDLGGHSLQAVAVFSQIEKVFGKSLPPATLFRAQTIEEIAAILRSQGCPSSWPSLVPIQPDGSRPPL